MMSEELRDELLKLLRILDKSKEEMHKQAAQERHKQAAQERLDDGGVRQVNIGHILRTKRPHKHRKKAARATRMAKEVGQIYLHQTQVRQAALRALRHRFRRFHHISIEVLGRPLGYRFELQDNAVVSYWPTGATGRPTAAVPMPQHFVSEVTPFAAQFGSGEVTIDMIARAEALRILRCEVARLNATSTP